jgi:hypothetical protein
LEKAHEKREITGVKALSKIGRDRAHLLSGILKCPKCGGQMYTNKHAMALTKKYTIMYAVRIAPQEVKAVTIKLC